MMWWITIPNLFFFFLEMEHVCSETSFHSVYVIIRLSSSHAIGVSIGRSICAGVV